MLPRLDARIVRRVLVNFWADPAVLRSIVPAPLELTLLAGRAVVGISLIRLEELRVLGMPPRLGITSENMAHHVSIQYPTARGMKDGLFVWRRDTDSPLLAQLGGKFLPAEFRPATFNVTDGAALLAEIATEGQEADLSLHARPAWSWRPSPMFASPAELLAFCRARDSVISHSAREQTLVRARLPEVPFELIPLRLIHLRSAFLENLRYFPPRSLGFDSAVLLRSNAKQSEAIGTDHENVAGFAAAA